MSEAIAAGVPVIGAHYGALGERIRSYGVGWVIDPMDHAGITALIERLDVCRDEVLRVTQRVYETPLQTVAETAPRYEALYRASPNVAAGLASA
jgi:glycosyltransferase involved in cell wall biosynthesis